MSHKRAVIVLALEGNEEWVDQELKKWARPIFHQKGTIKRMYAHPITWPWDNWRTLLRRVTKKEFDE